MYSRRIGRIFKPNAEHADDLSSSLSAEILRFVFRAAGREFNAVRAGVEPDAIGIASETSPLDLLSRRKSRNSANGQRSDAAGKKITAFGHCGARLGFVVHGSSNGFGFCFGRERAHGHSERIKN